LKRENKVTDSPYQKTAPPDMILRDYLAVERTVMANQRSFVACLRTMLSLVVAGASFIKFSGYQWMEIVGWVLVSLGIILAPIGAVRFLQMKRLIDEIRTGG
jgi:putative membrane protein